jgi:hypothetical protein
MTPSAIINKSLRKYVSPELRAAGFQKVDARNAWTWTSEYIWVFNIRAVGSYFSAVTGWPAASACVWIGVYYPFIPRVRPGKSDDKGRILPAEYECHMRSHLERRTPLPEGVSRLSNSAERKRKNIWWLEPDGSNADEVANDIAAGVAEVAVPWFREFSDLSHSLSVIEAGRDCSNKFLLAYHLASKVERTDLAGKYKALADAEAGRRGIDATRTGG